MAKTLYVTVAPVTPKGKWVVCSRRIGVRDRLAPIAECRSEAAADTIVDALNGLQGVLDKIDAPTASELAALKVQVARDAVRHGKERDLRQKEWLETHQKIRDLEHQLLSVKRERDELLRKAAEQKETA